jgi:hypothetical protein
MGKEGTSQLPGFESTTVTVELNPQIGENGKHKGKGPRTTHLTAQQISELAKNKGSGGPARKGAHLDRTDIGG